MMVEGSVVVEADDPLVDVAVDVADAVEDPELVLGF